MNATIINTFPKFSLRLMTSIKIPNYNVVRLYDDIVNTLGVVIRPGLLEQKIATRFVHTLERHLVNVENYAAGLYEKLVSPEITVDTTGAIEELLLLNNQLAISILPPKGSPQQAVTNQRSREQIHVNKMKMAEIRNRRTSTMNDLVKCIYLFTFMDIVDREPMDDDEELAGIKNWTLRNWHDNLQQILVGPQSNQDFNPNYRNYYAAYVHTAAIPDDIMSYRQLKSAESSHVELDRIRNQLIVRPNSYTKLPNVMGSHTIFIDTSAETDISNYNNSTYFKPKNFDIGSFTNTENTDRDICSIFRAFNRVSLSSAVFEKSLFRSTMSLVTPLFLVFDNLECQTGRSSNGGFTNGVIWSGKMIEENSNYLFIPHNISLTYSSVNLRSASLSFYLTDNLSGSPSFAHAVVQLLVNRIFGIFIGTTAGNLVKIRTHSYDPVARTVTHLQTFGFHEGAGAIQEVADNQQRYYFDSSQLMDNADDYGIIDPYQTKLIPSVISSLRKYRDYEIIDYPASVFKRITENSYGITLKLGTHEEIRTETFDSSHLMAYHVTSGTYQIIFVDELKLWEYTDNFYDEVLGCQVTITRVNDGSVYRATINREWRFAFDRGLGWIEFIGNSPLPVAFTAPRRYISDRSYAAVLSLANYNNPLLFEVVNVSPNDPTEKMQGCFGKYSRTIDILYSPYLFDSDNRFIPTIFRKDHNLPSCTISQKARNSIPGLTTKTLLCSRPFRRLRRFSPRIMLWFATHWPGQLCN